MVSLDLVLQQVDSQEVVLGEDMGVHQVFHRKLIDYFGGIFGVSSDDKKSAIAIFLEGVLLWHY